MREQIGMSLLNRWAVFCAATILLLTGGALFAGTLSGKVTSTKGQALANVFIDMYDATGEYFDYTVTDTNGAYKFSNLGTGGFYVHTDTLGGYVEEWYNNVPGASEDTFYDPLVAGATNVAVGSIDTVAGINLTLDQAGSISGRITGTNGAGLSRIYVDVYLPDGKRFQYDLTDTNGDYVVAGLPAGTYAVRTDSLGVFVDRWHDQTVAFDSVNPASADLAVQAGVQTSNVNIQLATGGEIRGTLRNAMGAPVVGVYIDLLSNSGIPLEFDRSDTNGAYQLKGLPAGNYYLGTDGLGAYVDLWFNQKLMVNSQQPAQDGADLVVVPALTIVTNVDFTFDVGATIAGCIVSTSGVPVVRAFVDVFLGTNYFDYGVADSNGYFEIAGLPDGTYYVKVDTLGAFLDEWHEDTVVLHPDDPIVDEAKPVYISGGLSVTSLVFTLRAGAEISGKLTDASSQGIQNVYLDLYHETGPRRFYTRSATNGWFRLGGLPGGTYYLNTVSDGYYADEWYDNRPVIVYTNPVADKAVAIIVSVGESRTNINIQLQAGGAIAGTVYATNSIRMTGATLNLFYGNRLYARSTTDTNGVYRIAALPDGTYFTRVDSAGDFLGEWYSGVQVLAPDDPIGDGATAIVMTNDAERIGVDFALGTGGGIQGTVASDAGEVISMAVMDLFDCRGRYFDSVVTPANGNYAFPSLPPGTWYVGTDTAGAYLDEWFDNRVRSAFSDALVDRATPVVLGEGTIQAVSFLLALIPPVPVVLNLFLEAGGGLILEWQAGINQAYQVERRLDLQDGDWIEALSGTIELESSFKPAGTAGLRQYRDPAPPGRAFYRVGSSP